MRHKIGGLILLCSLLLGGASAQSPALPQTLSVRVLGPVLAQPAALAPVAGVRQQIVLVSLGGGGVAVLVYRFGESGQPLAPAGDALLANKMAENLATSSGYREVSPAEAQKLANIKRYPNTDLGPHAKDKLSTVILRAERQDH